MTLVPDGPAGYLFPQVGYFDIHRVTPAVVSPLVTAELWNRQVIAITVRGHRYQSYAVEQGTWWLILLGIVLTLFSALTVRWRRLTKTSRQPIPQARNAAVG